MVIYTIVLHIYLITQTNILKKTKRNPLRFSNPLGKRDYHKALILAHVYEIVLFCEENVKISKG